IVRTEAKSKIYNEHFSFFLTIGPFVLIIQTFLYFLLFPNELISFSIIIMVLVIGLCDYISQEVYRYLMINESFRKGNIQLIYKSLLFVFLIITYHIVFKKLTFYVVLWIMLISYFILFLLAYRSFVKTLHRFKKNNCKTLNYTDFIKTIRAVIPFLVMVVFIKGIEFSDKFIIGNYLGLEE